MKPGWRILLAVAVCMLVVSAALVRPREREPEYQGKNLSDWILLYAAPGPTAGGDRQQAALAIQQIGSSGVPFVLRWIRFEHRRWPRYLKPVLDVWSKLSPASQRKFPADRRGFLAENAHLVFGVPGFDGSSAVPELIRMATDPASSQMVLYRSSVALELMGSSSLPGMLAALSDMGRTNRYIIVEIIGNTRGLADAKRVVPALIGYLEDRDLGVSASASRALGNLSLDLTNTVPALARALGHSNSWPRVAAAAALAHIGRPAAPAVPSLVRALEDPEMAVRKEATNALMKIEPEVFGTGERSEAGASRSPSP